MPGTIDCRGLSCPEPVLRVKAALEPMGEGVLSVLVDDSASRENVKRFAQSQGCTVQVEEAAGGTWRLSLLKGFSCEAPEARPAEARPKAPLRAEAAPATLALGHRGRSARRAAGWRTR